jgi:hypothetical protein
MMLFGAVSCKKDDTSAPNNADFFIDVAFLPESEANGEAAPRLVVNFNDEAAMIELWRPSTGTPLESVLLLCPDNEAMMLCGNDSLMVCAAYDMETYTPSHDVLIVTPMDDNALLLTKGFMDWNANTLTTGDMMVLPVEDNSKSRGIKGDIDGEIRSFFFNKFVKPLAESFDQVESFCGVFGLQGGIAFSYIKTTITTGLTTILYADDPEELYDATEFSVTMWASQVAQDGILHFLPEKYSEVTSRFLSLVGWHKDGGHGKVNDYVGGETDDFSYSTFLDQSRNAAESAGQTGVHPPAYNVNLEVSNVTENSAYLKGRFQYTSSITPVEMGYVFKVSNGPEHTEYDMNFQGLALSGLQKATKYTAFAYVQDAFGKRVFSPGIIFWTLGFEAFPSSLTFPAEGDTKFVGLSYSAEDITGWDITSKPSWCTITKDGDRTFSVKADKTAETRSGTIIVTGRSSALGSVKQDIMVTQLGTGGWDGTCWLFMGTITSSGSMGNSSFEQELTLRVNSVSNHDIVFSFAQEMSSFTSGYSDNYVIDENGSLVYTASGTYSPENGISEQINSRVAFVRTGSTTATAEFYCKLHVDGINQVMTGVLQGTLINAKGIGDYETTVDFREAFCGRCQSNNKDMNF